MAITFISFWGLTVITMFFLKYYDRLTTRAAVHPSLPASMVNQIDPEPVACCKQNGAECGGITIAAMVTWWHRHTSSYSIWLDDYEIGCFSESCSSKQLDLHGLIRFLECYWCPKYQNIPCWGIDTCSHDPLNFLHSNSILPGSTTMTCLQKSSSLQPISTPPLLWLFPSFSIAEAISFTEINPLRSFHLAEGPNVLKPSSSVRRRRASTL